MISLRLRVRPPASVNNAWSEFIPRLADVLAALEEDELLIVASKWQPGWVKFSALGYYGMRVEAPSNYYLKPDRRLSDNQLARLRELGWQPPTADQPSSEWVESDPDFEPNFHLDMVAPVRFDQLAELATASLRGAFRIHHPGMLWYEAYGRGRLIKFPTLRLMMIPQRQGA